MTKHLEFSRQNEGKKEVGGKSEKNNDLEVEIGNYVN